MVEVSNVYRNFEAPVFPTVVGVRGMVNVCRRHQQQEAIFDSVEI